MASMTETSGLPKQIWGDVILGIGLILLLFELWSISQKGIGITTLDQAKDGIFFVVSFALMIAGVALKKSAYE